MKQLKLASLVLAGAVGLAACTDEVPTAASPGKASLSASSTGSLGNEYLVIAKGNQLPRGLEDRIREAGGTLTETVPEIGLAIVTSTDPAFAARAANIQGLRSVVPDVTLQWIDPEQQTENAVSAQSFGSPPASGDDDFFFDLQWGHDAVDAAEAWNAGHRGAGARVAILDTGIDAEHPDLAPNLNTALSRSFVPGEGYNVRPGFFFDHGSHVAGTVAAADNAFGTIGVAPEAELVAVKVLSERTGSGAFSWIVRGIVHAANVDADVINMSLGTRGLRRSGIYNRDGEKIVNANQLAELTNLVSRATTYAYQKGSTVIVAAGNSAIDRDHDADGLVLPADAAHVIQIAATGPRGWGVDASTDLDAQAFYTNHGQSAINLSAPGGNVDFSLRRGNFSTWPVCKVVLTRPCWVFDLVFSTISQGWGWAAGTSMAAPHAAGVAAIIIGKNGGSMHPSQVAAELRRTADDIGKPGKDDLGDGRVNAGNSVR